MKPETTRDVENFLRMYLASAAVGTALELGLFWRLVEKPLREKEISQMFNIPHDRCKCWLALLTELELLEYRGEMYTPSSIANSAILEAYSPETWAFLAQEARERYQVINNLTSNISHPKSVWVAQKKKPPNYVTQMNDDPRRAERFTRMLYELHQPLAEKLAKILDMTGVKKVMDLGGGSGVVSLALLKRHANLNAVVVDIENVCTISRKIANKTLVANRITYHIADFLKDDLPGGFDMILECDVGIYNEELFRKMLYALNEGGRLVIVSNTNEQGAWLKHAESDSSLSRLLNAFISSLEVPRLTSLTISDVKTLLTKIGFQNILEQVQKDGIVIIQATK
ncbi:MAG: methyltransferase [Candidatus Hodarchaeales archaeon]